MYVIPKLTPDDAVEEVLRMTAMTLEEYSDHVQACGIEFCNLVMHENIKDAKLASNLADEFIKHDTYWQFFKNQVYHQSLRFIYEWYTIELTAKGYQMNLTAWKNSIRPNRIIARPPMRNLNKVLHDLVMLAPRQN
jgi:hypothetical protein